jgi:hypothetical protein
VHLHNLTERKLEKAVLGRAVGLRQLVLLSNAFASRSSLSSLSSSASATTINKQDEPTLIVTGSNDEEASYGLQYPTPSTSSSSPSTSTGEYHHQRSSYDDYDEELEAGIIEFEYDDEEEDEAERKRREEDWLDSVLDEMLTDAEDDDDATTDLKEQDEAALAHRDPTAYLERDDHNRERIPPLITRSEREFKEPYVHLSIKQHGTNSRHPSYQSSLPSSTSSASGYTYHPSSSSSSSALLAHRASLLQQEDEDEPESMFLETVTSPSLEGFSSTLEVEEEGGGAVRRSENIMADSGFFAFIEPSSIPLPDSTDTSPGSSANSQASDAGDTETEAEEVKHNINVKSDRDGQLAAKTPLVEDQMVEQHRQESPMLPLQIYRSLPISMTGTYNSTESPSPTSCTGVSLPELAYSATSLNTLSSSPSHSINLFTPGTSPPRISFPHKVEASKDDNSQGQWFGGGPQLGIDFSVRARDELEPQEIMLPMDDLDLDLYDDDDEGEGSELARLTKRDDDEERNSSSSGSTTSNEDSSAGFRRGRTSTRRTSALELVRYHAADEDDALRIPLYLPLSNHQGWDDLLVTRSQTESTSMPELPPSLLSVMLGKKPLVEVEVASSSSSLSSPEQDPRMTSRTPRSHSYKYEEKINSDKLKLPIFLPSEIVKSLYDSVDFGVPSRFSPTSSPLNSPSLHQSSAFDFSTTLSEASRGGKPFPSAPRSAPCTPRNRSKSLTQMEAFSPPSTHTSPGGLLFSSLGLFGFREDEQYASNRDGMEVGGIRDSKVQQPHSVSNTTTSSTFLPLFSTSNDDSFDRVSSSIRAGSSGATSCGAHTTSPGRARSMLPVNKNESRSPSRLRHYYDHRDTFADDFEFGSI